ncbi:MAG: response regulator transcription factor [Desulfobaccales bacterium]
MGRPYYIVLADDHIRFRREMRKILEEIPDIEIAGEAGNRQELLDLLELHAPEMVILDLFIPDLRAEEGTKLIKSLYPKTKVLITVMNHELEYLFHGLAAGAEGVLPKQHVAGHIFRAIAKVRQGKIYLPIKGSGFPGAVSEKAGEWAGLVKQPLGSFT